MEDIEGWIISMCTANLSMSFYSFVTYLGSFGYVVFFWEERNLESMSLSVDPNMFTFPLLPNPDLHSPGISRVPESWNRFKLWQNFIDKMYSNAYLLTSDARAPHRIPSSSLRHAPLFASSFPPPSPPLPSFSSPVVAGPPWQKAEAMPKKQDFRQKAKT